MIKKKVQKRKKKGNKKKSNKGANPPNKQGKKKKKKEKENNDFTNITGNNDISNIDPQYQENNEITDKNFIISSKTSRKINENNLSHSQNKSSEQEDKNSEDYKEKMNDYFNQKINRLEFEEAKELDERSFLSTICSYERDNGIIFFLFSCGKTDILSRTALLLLTISLYLFVNVMIMDTNAVLNLYTQKNKEKIIFNALCSNIFYPLLTYLITYTIKRKISVNDFFVNQYYKLYRILYLFSKGEITLAKKNLELHNIEAKISIRKNKAKNRLLLLLVVGFIFLGFNFYLVSSFCGIYENSEDCVIWNTVVSIIFSFIVSRVLFIISASLRLCSLREGKKSKFWFIISCILNPYYLSYCGKTLCFNLITCKICCQNKKEKENLSINEDNKKENKEEKNLKEGMIEISNE